MEQKRRHPNFIDIALILVLAAVAAVAWFLSHQDAAPSQDTVQRTYVLELTGLRSSYADYVHVGDTVTDNVKNYDMGIITAIEVRPATTNLFDKEAKVHRDEELPGKINLYLTIASDTVETENQINTASGYTLRVGNWVSCTVGQLTATGYIVVLDR